MKTIKACASVAQLDRVPGYEPGGQRFESSRTRHSYLVREKGNTLILKYRYRIIKYCALVAQLDRVPGYEPGGQRFESSRARHYLNLLNVRESIVKTIKACASVAQLDRVPGYEPGGQRFESSRTRHFYLVKREG